MAVALLTIGAFTLLHHGGMVWWPWMLSAGFGLVAWLSPGLLNPLNRSWLKLGLLLGRIVSPIAMAILFFLVITPIGLIMRLTGKTVMRVKFDRTVTSYWVTRDPPGPPEKTLHNQY